MNGHINMTPQPGDDYVYMLMHLAATTSDLPNCELWWHDSVVSPGVVRMGYASNVVDVYARVLIQEPYYKDLLLPCFEQWSAVAQLSTMELLYQKRIWRRKDGSYAQQITVPPKRGVLEPL